MQDAPKILIAIAVPMFLLAFAFAYKRRGQGVDIFGPRLRMVETREATAPRLAGLLLVVSLLLAGTAGTLFLLK